MPLPECYQYTDTCIIMVVVAEKSRDFTKN